MFTQLVTFSKNESQDKIREMAHKWELIFNNQKGLNGFAYFNNKDTGEFDILVLWNSVEDAIEAAKLMPELELTKVA